MAAGRASTGLVCFAVQLCYGLGVVNWEDWSVNMNRFNLDEYRARIVSCASKDLLIDAVSEMCSCAGYPYSEHMTIKDHADYTFLNGQKQLSHLLDIAAKRERSLR